MSIIKFTSLILVFSSLYLSRFTSSLSLSTSTASSYSYSASQSQEDEGTDPSCEASHEGKSSTPISTFRFRRAAVTPKHGVVVCITSKDSDLNLQGGGGKGKGKHEHSHNDDEDTSSMDDYKEKTPEDDEDSDSDSDETVEETDSAHNGRPGIGNSNNQHHNSKPPPRGKGKHKGNENFRLIIEERFSYRNWSSEWIHAHGEDNGTKIYNKFSRVYARKSNHSRPDYGIITHNKGGEFYLIATTFPPFSSRNETLITQFSVQFQSKPHCQLAFLRLYDCQFSTDDFTMQTPYLMQIGPHVCGTSRLNRVTAEFQEPGKTNIRPVDKNVEPVNNTNVNTYALALQPDGSYNIIVNTRYVQNGTLRDIFQGFRGYTGICGIGLAVWHSVLDKYFKGQIIVDDILVVNDMEYATKRRNQILNLYSK